jgi:hypothetical protein
MIPGGKTGSEDQRALGIGPDVPCLIADRRDAWNNGPLKKKRRIRRIRNGDLRIGLPSKAWLSIAHGVTSLLNARMLSKKSFGLFQESRFLWNIPAFESQLFDASF